MDDELLTFKGAMEFLGISDKTLTKLLREEDIPARKLGKEWRFSKNALRAWIQTGKSRDYTQRQDADEE